MLLMGDYKRFNYNFIHFTLHFNDFPLLIVFTDISTASIKNKTAD